MSSEDKIVRKLRKQLETALAKRREDEAADVLGKLMEADPKVPRWPHKRGDLLRKLNNNKLAIECFAAAATLYAEQGFIARAVAMAKTILNLDPSRIDVLERVDPEAARKLHRLQRPNSVPVRPAAGGRHPMLLDDDAPMQHSAVLPDDDAPQMRHHALLPDDDIPPLPPPRRHPMVLDDDGAAPSPPPLPGAAARRANLPAAKQSRAIILDEVSLPPMQVTDAALESLRVPPPPRLPSLSESVVDVDELTIAPDVRPNETRFSNAPPARRRRAGSIDIDLTDLELEQRPAPAALVMSSMPPPPPSPKQLSKLPLFPLFAEVPKAALSILVQGADVIELQDGAVVMRKGDAADAVYGIVEGAVQVGGAGQQMRSLLAEGDVFGESALLGEKRHHDVVVKGYLVALKIPRPLLNQLLAAHPPLAEVFLELLTRRLIGNLLQSSPLFQEFDARGRQEIVRMFEVRRAPANAILAEQGKLMDALYISLTGEIDVGQRGQPITQYGAGTMFGHGCMLTHSPSNISVRTRMNMLVLRLPSSAFHALAMQYPAILAEVSERIGSDVTQVVV
jgi:CRP-like cAMP-binding protein